MINNVSAFYKCLKFALNWLLCPSRADSFHNSLTVKDFEHLSTEEFGDHFMIVSARDWEPHDLPRVLVAPGPTYAIQPCVKWSVMIFDIEILFGLELERFVTGYMANTRPTTNWLLSCRGTIPNEDFHMYHVMFLHMHRFVIVCTIEDQVTRPQFRLFQNDRQSIKLIGLISTTKSEAKLYPEVADSARY